MTRGLLLPFCVQSKTATFFTFPAFLRISSIPQLDRVYRARYVRFFCSQPRDSMDISIYKDKFARRMDMAGLKPHHRIAMAVSGGPDSMALCVLTANWKIGNCDVAKNGRNNFIDGLLAIVVDHGLRAESADEAWLVYNRTINMGIKCEVAHCEWLNGRPKLGHLQETARNKRYELLQDICIQQQIDILLVAHHEDDQAELFILRLSRKSGVLGLAGMAFMSQIFPKFLDFDGLASKARGILLVRPLLEFSKEEMYNICRVGNQQWVEDPTNKSSLYARNRIRMSLSNLSASKFKSEILEIMSACRKTRRYVDKLCGELMNQAVAVIPHGYAVIDLETLHSSYVNDMSLSRFIALVLQFISQRQRPVRGSGLKLVLEYLHTFPCKTSLTVASCYLCPAPGSKGTKVLVCCSINSSYPLKMELFPVYSCRAQNCHSQSQIEQILNDSGIYSDKFIPDALDVPLLNATSSESILVEANMLGILSESTHKDVASLVKEEIENFKSKSEVFSVYEMNDDVKSAGTSLNMLLYPGQTGYFMSRFIVSFDICYEIPNEVSRVNKFLRDKELVAGQCSCGFFSNGDEMVIEVRGMIDTDWIYLSELSKLTCLGDALPQFAGKTNYCSDHVKLSAQRALVSLKSIPVAARRSLPVLINTQGVLLSIPSIGFTCCLHLMVSAVFCPRVPLGGGHSSFL